MWDAIEVTNGARGITTNTDIVPRERRTIIAISLPYLRACCNRFFATARATEAIVGCFCTAVYWVPISNHKSFLAADPVPRKKTHFARRFYDGGTPVRRFVAGSKADARCKIGTTLDAFSGMRFQPVYKSLIADVQQILVSTRARPAFFDAASRSGWARAFTWLTADIRALFWSHLRAGVAVQFLPIATRWGLAVRLDQAASTALQISGAVVPAALNLLSAN